MESYEDSTLYSGGYTWEVGCYPNGVVNLYIDLSFIFWWQFDKQALSGGKRYVLWKRFGTGHLWLEWRLDLEWVPLVTMQDVSGEVGYGLRDTSPFTWKRLSSKCKA